MPDLLVICFLCKYLDIFFSKKVERSWKWKNITSTPRPGNGTQFQPRYITRPLEQVVKPRSESEKVLSAKYLTK